MSGFNTSRVKVQIPPPGEVVEVRVTGIRVFVEDAPDASPEDIATIHIQNPTGDGIPAVHRAEYIDSEPFQRLFLKGGGEGEGEDVHLIILSSRVVVMDIPA